MYESVIKFSKYSTVEQQSTMKLSEVEIPDIYICNKDQFNLHKSLEFGYTHQSYFLAGMAGVETKFEKGTWGGISGESNFSDLMQKFYGVEENMYDSLKVNFYDDEVKLFSSSK